MNIRRLLVLLILLPATSVAQQSYYGTTVSSVRLSPDDNSALVAQLPIKTGDVIRPENVRAAIQTLFDTGQYRSIEVDAVSSGGGTELTFNVVTYYFFSTFRLLPETLVDRPLSSLIRLPIGQKFSEERVQEAIDETREVLEDSGYFNRTITPTIKPDSDPQLRAVELQVSSGPVARIGAIQFDGAQSALSEKELRDALHLSAGSVYSRSDVDKGITAIRAKFLTRDFLNTKVDSSREYDPATNTVRLTVTVSPGQRTVVELTGKNEVSQEEIRTLLPVFEEGLIDDDLLREGRANIVEHLQQKGFFDASVTEPTVTTGDEGTARIAVEIDAGQRHTVNSIKFSGNTVFTDQDLRAMIRVRPAGFLNFLNHGLFSEDLAKGDATRIQLAYRRTGYEAAFVEPKFDDTKHEIDLVFEITENIRYNIERILFSGNESIPEAELLAAISLKDGDPWSPAKVEEAQTALTRLYYKNGYPDFRVEAAAERNVDTGNRILTFRITEGPRYRIREILVAGNRNTADKLVRRSSGLQEYKWYNPEDVLDGQQKLYATGLFRHVSIVPLDRETGEFRTVLIEVDEAKHILVVPGVGVKEYAGPRAILDISHNNLFGLNQTLVFRVRAGIYEQQFQASYRQPRLFNHDDIDGSASLTIEQTNRKIYEASGVELAVQARKKLSPIRSALMTASYQTTDLEHVNVSPTVRQSPDLHGVIQIARLGPAFVNDGRDDALDPKRGMLTTSTLQIASQAIGSEVNFWSFFDQVTYQRPTGFGTLAMSERLGIKVPYGKTQELPITERFFAGGSTTLRGFGLDEAGPPGGGQLLAIGNVEYRMPIMPLFIGQLNGAVFYDTGNVFERPSDFAFKDFTHSAGTGLRLNTPLGPARFDIGVNLFPKTRLSTDGTPFRESRVHIFFTLGHAF